MRGNPRAVGLPMLSAKPCQIEKAAAHELLPQKENGGQCPPFEIGGDVAALTEADLRSG
jgi:hypothetical protein